MSKATETSMTSILAAVRHEQATVLNRDSSLFGCVFHLTPESKIPKTDIQSVSLGCDHIDVEGLRRPYVWPSAWMAFPGNLRCGMKLTTLVLLILTNRCLV